MTSDRDIERLLDTWLGDGPLQVADRVIDDAAARIAQQTQRPAWRLRTWRLPTMTTPIRFIALTGVLLAALIAGSVLLVGGGGGPTPTATPMPSASQTAPSTPPPDLQGTLVPGDYLAHPSATDPLTARITVPDGWAGGGWYLNKGNVVVAFLPHPRPPADPCQAATGSSAPSGTDSGSGAVGPSLGGTVEAVVAALRAQPAYGASAPTAVQIGGYDGQRLSLQLNVVQSQCPGVFYVFAEPDGMYAQGQGNQWTVWILDVDGSPMAIVVSDFGDTPAALVAEAQAIVESTVITP
jgi:hypothetical protein